MDQMQMSNLKEEEVRQYLLKLLTALGQMDHPRGKDAEHGIMTMKVDVRAQLISEGWELLEPGCQELRAGW